MADAWFETHRCAICKATDAAFSDVKCHALPPNGRDVWFSPLVQAYQVAAATRAMCVPVQHPCCAKNLDACGARHYQRTMLIAMRALAWQTAMQVNNKKARCIELPCDMLREIANRLTKTEYRAWRHADPRVRARFPPARASYNWRKIVEKYHTDTNIVDHVIQLCQPAYDDDLVSFMRMWLEPVYAKQSRWTHALREVVGMGGATQIYRYLTGKNYMAPQNTYDKYVFYDTMIIDAAVAHDKRVFIHSTLGWASSTLFRYLIQWSRNDNHHGTHGQRNPLVLAAKNRHFALVAWFVTQCKEYHSEVPSPILQACCAYGDLDTLAQFPERCTVDMIHYTFMTGTSAAGLVWLQTHRPDLFLKDKAFKKHKALIGMATKRSAPAVLAWLLDMGHLDMARDGRHLYEHAAKNKYTRTLRWLEEVYTRDTPREEWPTWLVF